MRFWFAGLMMITVLFLSACTGEEKQTEEKFKNPIEISLWHYYIGNNKTQLETAIEEFNNTVGLEKGIIVTAEGKGNITELEEAVTKASLGLIDSEEMPDIFSIYPDKAIEFGEKGFLCDLRDYFSADELSLYVDMFLEDGILCDNKLFMLPIAKSTEFLYINATDFDQFCKDTGYGYEALTTWEGLLDLSKAYYHYTDAMTKKENDGKSFFGIDSTANYILISSVQLGADVINSEKEKAELDRDVLQRIFENYYIGHVLGYYDMERKYRADDVRTGQLLSYVGSSSSAVHFPTWLEYEEGAREIDLKILPYPVFEGGMPCAIRQGAGMCISVSDREREKAAAEFLKWFTAAEVNNDFTRETGYLPVTKQAYRAAEDPENKDSQEINPVRKNTMMAYRASIQQILNRDSYSPNPFLGSYKIRSIMEKTLTDFADDGVETVQSLREMGKTDEEIITQLNPDEQFELWMQQIYSQFKHNNVDYEDR